MSFKKHIINIVSLFFIIMCFGLSIGYYNNLKDGKKVINFYLEDQEYSVSTLEQLQNDEESKNNYTGWKQIDDVSLTVNEIKKSALADMILISGDSQLVVNGKLLFKEDKSGCLIDEETSYKLFGSTNVIGNTLMYKDRKLVVRGIHKGSKNTIVAQMPYNSDIKLDGISVSSNRSIEVLASNLGIINHSISTEAYSGIGKLFLMLMPLFIFIPLVFKIVVKAFKERKMIVRFILYGISLIILSFIFIKITDLKITIPYDIIPDKWSNFEYWSGYFEKTMEDFKFILYMKKYNMDIYYLEILGKNILFSILTVSFFIALRKRIKISSAKECIIALGIVLLIEFIVFVKINTGNNLYIGGSIFWLIYPYFIILEKWLWPLFKMELFI